MGSSWDGDRVFMDKIIELLKEIRDELREKGKRAKQRINTRKLIIETLKNEKIELLEENIKLRKERDTYIENIDKLKNRNRKLHGDIKDLREKEYVRDSERDFTEDEA